MTDRVKPEPKRQTNAGAAPSKPKYAAPATQSEDAELPVGPNEAVGAATNADASQQAKGAPSRQRRLVGTLILLSLVFAACATYLNLPPSGQRLSLDKVLRLTLEKKVTSITFLQQEGRIAGTGVIDPDNKPSGARALEKSGPKPKAKRFWTAIPRSDATFNDIFKTFFSSGTHITIDNQTPKRYVHYLELFVLALVLTNFAVLASPLRRE